MIYTRDILIINNINISKKDIISCIYKIINPIGKIYIGSTVIFYGRICNYVRYINNNINEQPKLINSFKKYDIRNHKFEIEYVTNNLKELHQKEIDYIFLYDSVKNGLNISSGGREFFNHSEESKNKISIANKGRKFSLESREKMSLSSRGKISNRKGVVLSKETKDKISNSKKNMNLKISNNHKKILSECNKGKIISDYQKLMMKEGFLKYLKNNIDIITDNRIKNCKAILQYDLQMRFIREITRTELRLEGFNVDAIKRVLNNKAKTSSNFIWKYKE
jgi:group I intron endonuclease